MQLQLRTFSTIVSSAAASVQGAASQLIDLSVGSTLRAILEAHAGTALWLQWLILLVLRTTRAATSTGPDLDTWVADFTLTRLPGVPSIGSITFSRFTPTLAAVIPVGTGVRTSDGTQSFVVTADPTNAAYSAAQSAFVLGAGIASLTVPATASAVGSAGNVQPNAISLIAAALPGIDTVTNAASFQGGLDAESDTALRARFGNFLSSRSRATSVAIQYAIAGVQQGLLYTIQENVAPNGVTQPGCFVITLDDGSGNPPASLLSTVYTAVDAIRPLGSIFTVRPPVITGAVISLAITTNAAVVHANVAATVNAAVSAYVNTLPIGAPLAWSRLTQLAYGASPSVTNVAAVLLNGSTADLVPPPYGIIKAASVAVN